MSASTSGNGNSLCKGPKAGRHLAGSGSERLVWLEYRDNGDFRDQLGPEQRGSL